MNNRIGRLSYFLKSFQHSIQSGLALFLSFHYLESRPDSGILAVSLTVALIAVIILVSIIGEIKNTVRRFHDLDRSGHYLWWCCVPLVNFYWYLQLFFAKGKSTVNRFGEPEAFDGTRNQFLKTGITFVTAISMIFAVLWNKQRNELSSTPALPDAPKLVQQQNTAAKKLVKKVAKSSAKERLLLRQAKQKPCDPDVHHHVGEYLKEAGRLKKLEKFYNSFRSNCGEFLELRWMVYSSAKKQGDFPRAKRLVTALIEDYPEDKDYRAWRGLLMATYRQHAQAAADFEKALQLAPKLNSIPLNLVRQYEMLKKSCKAEKTLERYIHQYPELNKDSKIKAKQKRLKNQCLTESQKTSEI